MRAKGWLSGALVTVALAAGARGGDPFLITAHTTSGSPDVVTDSGKNLPDLVNKLLKNEGPFSSLHDRDFSATVRYGGLNNAVLLSRNATSTSATLTFPATSFSKTFTGNASNLEKQIENYAKEKGPQDYGKFMRSINETSTLGVTDGNPLATTALLTSQAFGQFGLQTAPVAPIEGMPNPLDQVATPDIRMDINSGYVHTDTGSGYYAGGAFSLGFKFGDRVGLVLATAFSYRNAQGADVYNFGEEISLPILLIEPEGDKTFSWLVTPTIFGGAAASYELASGGTFLGGGVTSSLSFQYETYIFTLANQFDYFHGFPFSFANYKIATNLDQDLFKNGLKITKFFGETFYIDAGFSYTNFLQKAAVREFWSPFAGLGFRLGSYSGVRLGYTGDIGNGFTVTGGQLEFYFNY